MRKITILLLTLFSGISHVIYGLMSIVLPFYDDEFIRYGFENFRCLIGSSQIIFGVCLILGLYYDKLKLISSFDRLSSITFSTPPEPMITGTPA